jgi:hypothetical protein
MATLAVFLVVAGGAAYAASKLKLKNNSVTTPKIRDGAVTNSKLADGAISSSKIGDGAVTASKIAAGALGAGTLGDGSVTTGKIADGAVTPGKTSFALDSGRVASNPTLNQTLHPPLVSAGGVDVSGDCSLDNTNGRSSSIVISSSSTAWVSGVYISGGAATATTGPTPFTVGPVLHDPFAPFHASATVTIVTPTNALHLSLYQAINFQGDECSYSAAGFFG